MIDLNKKIPHQRVVWIDGISKYYLNEDIIDSLNLFAGKELTDSEYNEIVQEEQLEKAKKYILGILNHKSYSEFEIIRKLKNKGFSKNIISRIINWLKDKKFINDEEFAFWWIQSRIKNKPVGRYKLIQDLKIKGINQIIIHKVINEAYAENDELTLAKNLAQKKVTSLKQKNIPLNPEKIFHFLLRRGFPPEICEKVYAHIINNLS